MQTLLGSLTGTCIKLEQMGDVSVTGRLVNVQTDYASILTDKQQIIHYPFAQIKSVGADITELPKDVPVPETVLPETLALVLESLLAQPIKIENGDGAREGILSEIVDDALLLFVSPKQVVYYPLNQIKNVSPIYKLITDATANASEESTDSQGNSGGASTAASTGASAGGGAERSVNGGDGGKQDNNHQKQGNDDANQTDTPIKPPKMFNIGLARKMLDNLWEQEPQRQTHTRRHVRSRSREDSRPQSNSTPSFVTTSMKRKRPRTR